MKPSRVRSAVLALLLLCAVGVLTISGCRRETAAELTIAVNAGVEGDALKAAAGDYEKRFGVRIAIVELPYANLFEKQLVDLVTGTGAYDVIMLDDPWLPRYAESGRLMPLEPLFEKKGMPGPARDFLPACLAVCRHPYQSGPFYALPYVGNAQIFFYRKDLFDKYGLRAPATWTDVHRAARIISRGENNIYGYVMRAAQGNAVVADFMPLFWAFEAEMFDKNGNPTVNSAQGIAALNFMLALGKSAPPGYASFNADEVAAHLLQGTAAMSINWPAWIPAVDDPTKSRVVGKIAFAPIPGEKVPGVAAIGNWLLAIPRGSRNVDRAFDFLLWATSPAQMKISALRGNPPTRRTIFHDPALLKQYRSYPAQLQSLETSRPRPRTPLWNEVENAFGVYLSKANAGELSAEEALERANAEIAEIMKRNR
ncbi:MAG: ABC transporter substrate-binding protein [Terriglobia bacterium]